MRSSTASELSSRARALCLAALCLSACTTTPPAEPQRTDAEAADRIIAEFDLRQIEARAERMAAPARLRFLLALIRSAMDAEDALLVESLITLADDSRGDLPSPTPGAVDPRVEPLAELAVASAWLALRRGDPETALALLDQAALMAPAQPSPGSLLEPLQLKLLRADVLSAAGQRLAAVRQRTQALPLLAAEARDAQLRLLWDDLQRFGTADVRIWADSAIGATEQALAELAGLSAREYLSPDALRRDLAGWRARWSDLTDVTRIADLAAEQARVGVVPDRIALLLPLSGRYGPFGTAVADGFMAAYYRDVALPGNAAPLLTFIDSASGDPARWLAEAQQSASTLVVGPLLKPDVTALLERTAAAEGPGPDLLLLNIPEYRDPAAPAADPGASADTTFPSASAPGTDPDEPGAVSPLEASRGLATVATTPADSLDAAVLPTSGPGTADGVDGLANDGTALQEPLPHRLAFDLSPENDGIELATRLRAEGFRRALVVIDDADAAVRSHGAWAARWQALGGEIVAEMVRASAGSTTEGVADLLLIDQSEARADALDRLLDDPFEFTPRRRDDFDVVLLFVDHDGARATLPALRYFFVDTTPVYAVSAAAPPRQEMDHPDLDGLRLLVPNWLVGADPIAADVALYDGRLQRFVALGADAYRAARRWPPAAGRIPGSAGVLEIQPSGRIQVTPSWGFVSDGRVGYLPMVVDAAL